MAQPTLNKANEDHNGMKSDNSSSYNKWSHCSSNRRRKPQQIRPNLQQSPLRTSNQFEPLANLNDGEEYPKCFNQVQVSNGLTVKRQGLSQSVKKTNNIKHNIVIIGDSYARNCAAELRQNLDTKFAISNYVKPGAGMSVITHTVKEEIKKLKSNDVVVVWGGSIDIGKNNTQDALRHLSNFGEKRRKVNIVVMSAPPRYDLIPSSCVNNEVIRFN